MVERKFLWIILISLGIVLLDQLTKLWMSSSLQLHESVAVIPQVLYFTHVTNTGAGFGLLKDFGWALIWLSLIVLGYIFYSYEKIPERAWSWIAVGLIVGGILGNFIDRIAAGYVVDFIDLRFWPVFNIADSALSVGAIMLIIDSFKK